MSNAYGAVTSAVANLTVVTDLSAVQPLAGSYNGLFYETNGVRHESSGWITFKVATNAAISGRLILDGDAVSFASRLKPTGIAPAIVRRGQVGKEDLTVKLLFNFSGDTDKVTGTVSNNTWLAELTADRGVWNSTNPATAYTNNYTMLIPGGTDAAIEPIGYGCTALTVSTQGILKTVNGTFADGQLFSQSVGISTNGQWPFYARLYRTVRIYTNLLVTNATRLVTNKNYYTGSSIGWLTITNNGIEGNVNWIKPSWTNEIYPSGFTRQTAILGSRYSIPAAGTRVLDMTNGTLTFTGGNLSTPYATTVLLTTNNVLTTGSTTNYAKPYFIPKIGLIGGGLRHPDITNKITRIYGAVLQNQNFGGGFFLGTNQSGKVLLQAE